MKYDGFQLLEIMIPRQIHKISNDEIYLYIDKDRIYIELQGCNNEDTLKFVLYNMINTIKNFHQYYEYTFDLSYKILIDNEEINLQEIN